MIEILGEVIHILWGETMPYIPSTKRNSLDYSIDYISIGIGNSEDYCGELNYSISRILNNILMNKGLVYKTVNDLIGVLECAKLELYRRIASPYEDKKMLENGEVYTIIEDLL